MLHLLLCHQFLSAQCTTGPCVCHHDVKSNKLSSFSIAARRPETYLFLCSLLLGRDHVVTFVFLHRAQHANAHLVGAAEQLQTLLMLRADLPVQVTDFIHQLVPLEGGRLVVRLEMPLTVGGQTHEASLDGFVLLANADVAADVLGSRVVVVGGRWRRWKGLAVAWEGGMA